MTEFYTPKTIGKSIVLYILIIFLASILEDKRFWPEWQEEFSEFCPLLISSR
jgi:hypothetical protein